MIKGTHGGRFDFPSTVEGFGIEGIVFRYAA
jgi:hypothetical protein